MVPAGSVRLATGCGGGMVIVWFSFRWWSWVVGTSLAGPRVYLCISQEGLVLEDLISAIALRYGFRGRVKAVWDGGQFDASRDVHQLTLTAKDGTQATAWFSPEAMGDPWKQLGEIEAAFKHLARVRRSRPSE